MSKKIRKPAPITKCPRCNGSSLLKNHNGIECLNCSYEVIEIVEDSEVTSNFYENRGKIWGR